jgi:hypothetical protein
MLILLLLLTIAQSIYAQKVEDIDLSAKPEIQYIDIFSQPKGLSGKVVIVVNYGQAMKDLLDLHYVKDENGKNYQFNNLQDALNKFYGWGWELVTFYSEENRYGDITHAVMKRKDKTP